MVRHVFIPAGSHIALSWSMPCLHGSSIQGKALYGRAKASSLKKAKSDVRLDLPLKIICYSSIFLQVDCLNLTEARVRHHIKIIIMEMLLWSPYPGAILLMTCHLKSLLPWEEKLAHAQLSLATM